MPVMQIGGHVSDADYPYAIGRRAVGGLTAVRFLINERGRVATCEVTTPSASERLDQIVCAIVQGRFRYRPARDAQGRPTSQWQTIRWEWLPPRSIRFNSGARDVAR